MTRFNITLDESIQMVDWAFKNALGKIAVAKFLVIKYLIWQKQFVLTAILNLLALDQVRNFHEELLNERGRVSIVMKLMNIILFYQITLKV